MPVLIEVYDNSDAGWCDLTLEHPDSKKAHIIISHQSKENGLIYRITDYSNNYEDGDVSIYCDGIRYVPFNATD